MRAEHKLLKKKSLHYSHSEGVHLISTFIAYTQSNPSIGKDSITILRRQKDITENCRINELNKKKISEFFRKDQKKSDTEI